MWTLGRRGGSDVTGGERQNSYHAGTSVIVSGEGRNATVHDLKPKWNAQTQQSREWMQISS